MDSNCSFSLCEMDGNWGAANGHGPTPLMDGLPLCSPIFLQDDTLGAPLVAVRLGWNARWGDTHRQLSEQAVLVQGFVSQQSTNGEAAEQGCCPFAPVALSG